MPNHTDFVALAAKNEKTSARRLLATLKVEIGENTWLTPQRAGGAGSIREFRKVREPRLQRGEVEQKPLNGEAPTRDDTIEA